ncbi:MAG: flagellar motor protein MotB [Acidocella sp. 20-58-15]|nr:MAG: flagellar motor protein MotB [Acidocella sp. 20-58-15]
MKFRLALLAATVLAAPFALSHAAHAQPVTGPYVAGGFGYNIENSQKAKDLTVNGTGQPFEAKLNMKNGYTGEASLGYGFGNGFRAEVEGDYIHDSANKVKADGFAAAASGSEARYGIFGNVLYDFDIGLPYLYPYIGVGIGWQEDNFNNFNAAGASINKTRGALAYQGIAGLAIPISTVPGLSATVEYRFVGLANSRKFNGSFSGLPASAKFLHEYNNQILVGLRYQLFTPPPMAPAPMAAAAPAASPAPVQSQTYLVFFDWDKSDLTPRATQIIAQAASTSKTNNVTTLDVSGYTDTSGTPTYNMGLSERRAKAVASQLVADGVPQSEIEIHSFGETHLLVATGPGVREPQNRRVEIVLK